MFFLLQEEELTAWGQLQEAEDAAAELEDGAAEAGQPAEVQLDVFVAATAAAVVQKG